MWFVSLKLPSCGLAPSKPFDLSISNGAASKVRLEPQCPNVSKQSGEAASTQEKRAALSTLPSRGQFGRDVELWHPTPPVSTESLLHLVLLSVQTIVGCRAWHPGDCCAGGREHHHGRSEAEAMHSNA